MRLGKQVANGEDCSKHTLTFCVLPMTSSAACLCNQGVPATYANPVETVLENLIAGKGPQAISVSMKHVNIELNRKISR